MDIQIFEHIKHGPGQYGSYYCVFFWFPATSCHYRAGALVATPVLAPRIGPSAGRDEPSSSGPKR